MSLERIKDTLGAIQKGADGWNHTNLDLQYLNIMPTSKYASWRLKLTSEAKNNLMEHVIEKCAKKIARLIEDTGETVSNDPVPGMFKLNVRDQRIADAYKALLIELADPDVETLRIDPTFTLVMKCSVRDTSVKMISIQNDRSLFKQKNLLFHERGEVALIGNSVPEIDVIVIDDTAYFLSEVGRSLFPNRITYAKAEDAVYIKTSLIGSQTTQASLNQLEST